MDIAALSRNMAQSSLKEAVSISVLKMSNDQAAIEGQALIQLMEKSVLPHLGSNIDIKA